MGLAPAVENRTGPVAGTSAAVTRDDALDARLRGAEAVVDDHVREGGRGCRALQPADIGAPPLEIENSAETSGRSARPWPPSASSSGLATASPTTVIELHALGRDVRHTRSGSSEPSHQHHRAAGEEPHERRPLGGGVHQRRERQVGEPSTPMRSGSSSGDAHLALEAHRVAAAEAGEERVLLPPHDALGQAGGAAGVHDVVVVAAAVAARRSVGRRRGRGRPRSSGPVARVHARPGEVGQHGGDTSRRGCGPWRTPTAPLSSSR